MGTVIKNINLDNDSFEEILSETTENIVAIDKELSDISDIAQTAKVVLESAVTYSEPDAPEGVQIDKPSYEDEMTDVKAQITDIKSSITGVSSSLSNTNAQLSGILSELLDKTSEVPTLTFGMNSVIKRTGDIPALPKFTVTGKSLTNLLGKLGNCEDASKWTPNSAMLGNDGTNNRVFGVNSIKISTTATIGYLYTTPVLDTSKYYLFSAYIKNVDATSVVAYKYGSKFMSSSLITDTTQFLRVGIKLQPGDFAAGDPFGIRVTGSVSGKSCYVDGIMINEITQSEYNTDINSLLNNYPYIDSYSCLINPYVEIKHNNMIRNGNAEEGVGWWVNSSSGTPVLSVINGKFQLATTLDAGYVYQTINVKPNTNYYLSASINGTSGSKVRAINYLGTGSVPLLEGTGTFNSGNNSTIVIALQIISGNNGGTALFDSIMLIEGTTAPSQYLSCQTERVVLETKLAEGDYVTYDNGKINGLLNWRHKTLLGKDYDCKYDTDFTGYKRIIVPVSPTPLAYIGQCTDYLGNMLYNVGNASFSNYGQFSVSNLYSGAFFSINDSDSGWSETLNPNNDEVKCFMNGWKSLGTANSRYVCWASVIDGSLPAIAITTTVSTAYTSGGTSLVVADATKLTAGDWIGVMRTTGYGFVQITSISGNTLTIPTLNANASVGAIVIKCDNGTTDFRLLNYCKSNTAPAYEGYQLHYKPVNPEVITDNNCSAEGDILSIDTGDNYVFVDSGRVINEIANPVSYATKYYINDINLGSNGMLSNKVDSIYSAYKNGILDTNWSWASASNWLEIPQSSFDINAKYSVDYKILATQAPQIGGVSCSYNYDIITGLSNALSGLNGKQQKDSTLEDILDKSLYEKIDYTASYRVMPWFMSTSTTLYACIEIPLLPKKSVPRITLSSLKILSGYSTGGGIDVTNKFSIDSIKLDANMLKIGFITTDATTITNIKTYGVQLASLLVIADCRVN